MLNGICKSLGITKRETMPEQEFLLKEAISKLLYLEKSRLEFFNIHTSSDQNSLLFLFFFFFGGGGGGGNQVFASQAQVETKEKIFWVKLTP